MFSSSSKMFAPLKRYLERLELVRQLTQMDDRLLDDIGITRFDIHAVADGELLQKNENDRIASTSRLNPKIVPNSEPGNDDHERLAA